MTNLSSKPTLKQFMELAFDPDEYCLVAHDKPFLNRKSILMGQAETLAGFKSDGGSWIGINPCDDTGTYEKGNVTAIRNIVFEADNMPLGEQETIIKSLKIPYSAAVYSGGKSFHIWIPLIMKLSLPIRKDSSNIFSTMDMPSTSQSAMPIVLCGFPRQSVERRSRYSYH